MTAARTVEREHGRTKYVLEKCRCQICRRAAVDYERERRQRIEPAYVFAGPVREHLAFLSEQGIGAKSVARVTGLSYGAISKIIYGDRTRGMGPSKRVRKATADRILAVTPSVAPEGTRVPAGPVLAQVGELVAAGVPKVRIAERIGQSTALQLGSKFVTRGAARAIAEMHAEMRSGTLVTERRSRHGATAIAPPPSETTTIDRGLLREQLFGQLAEVLEARVEARAWSKDAACRNRPTYVFFPDRGDSATAAKARKVCGSCVVRPQCLAANLDVREGVYGGTSARERQGIRTGRAA